ncbi:hypothetical protein [Cetobacterium sp.]|uniref:hypothetical protein n=1 Tax=Cetobacterium sp. TaxID=2071632 RepID=UPI003F4079C7
MNQKLNYTYKIIINGEIKYKTNKIDFIDYKRYLKKRNDIIVKIHIFSNLNSEDIKKCQELILNDPKKISLNGEKEINIESIFIVTKILNNKEIDDLEIIEII